MYREINALSRMVADHFDSYFKDFGLTTSYVELLLEIKELGPSGQSELSEKLRFAPSTITRFIAKLEKRELVNREKEGRSVIISLTEKGAALVKQLNDAYETARTDLEDKLGPKYVDTTRRLLVHGLQELSDRKEST
jgi:DNA-binding MarR family transcriptional regulator